MMNIGAYSVQPVLPVVFKNTASAINTSAASNWFAEPNKGHTLVYPPSVSKYPKNNVTTVAKYLLVKIFCHTGIFDVSVVSPRNSSWKDIRPIRATESSDVSASADTHIVINTVAS